MNESAKRPCSDVYLTVLSTLSYVPGVKALKRSLRKVGSGYPLYILIPAEREEEFRDALSSARILDDFCQIITRPGAIFSAPQYLEGTDFSHWGDTFFKLQVSGCTEFKKIILLDCDMMVVKNIDHLFDAPHYSAIIAGQTVHPEWVDLTSGLMVIEPNTEWCRQLIDLVEPTIRELESEGKFVGDQDVFQRGCPDWKEKPELHLSELYNCYLSDVNAVLKSGPYRRSDFKVIHFIGRNKPWHRHWFAGLRQMLVLLKYKKFWQMWLLFRYMLLTV